MSSERDANGQPGTPSEVVIAQVTHDIGRGGAVAIETTTDDIRVRGVDGTVVRLVSPSDTRRLVIERGSGRFAVRTERGTGGIIFGVRIGSFGFGSGVGTTIELEVPRDARLDIATASGDVGVRDVTGAIRTRTASGDVAMRGVGGEIAFHAASGDLHAEAVAPVRLRAETMSGDVELDGPRFDAADVRTLSGDVELSGTFERAGVHAIETTSGDIELSVNGGVTIDVRTVSGDLDVAHPERVGGWGRRDPVVIGDGAARLSVRTLSGDVEVRRGRPTPIRPGPTPGAAPAVPPLPAVPTLPAVPPLPAVPTLPAVPPLPAVPTLPAVPPLPAVPTLPAVPPLPDEPTLPAVPPLPDEPTLPVAAAAAEPDALPEPVEPAAKPGAPAAEPSQAASADDAQNGNATLALLEALARGEIDVDEAERRIVAAQVNREGASDE